MKSKIVAGLLALFVGGIGVHKFYLGKISAGVIYLLFSWTLVPSFIAFFEAFGFFLMTDENFNKFYN